MKSLWEKVWGKIHELEERPLLFLSTIDYLNIRHFLLGYFYAIEDVTGESINHDFTLWLSNRHSIESSLYWPSHIYYLLANENQDKAVLILFDMLKKFIQEKNLSQGFQPL